MMDPEVLRKLTEELIPFNKFMGVRATHVGPGVIRIELPWKSELVGNPVKPAMHGGVISMMADTAGGLAAWGALEGQNAHVSTVDLRIDYMRPGKLETLVAEANVLRQGKTLIVTDIRLFHPSNEAELIAVGRGVYAVKHAKASTR